VSFNLAEVDPYLAWQQRHVEVIAVGLFADVSELSSCFLRQSKAMGMMRDVSLASGERLPKACSNCQKDV